MKTILQACEFVKASWDDTEIEKVVKPSTGGSGVQEYANENYIIEKELN